MKQLIFLLSLLLGVLSLQAQEQSSPILFIYDASGSMWGQLEGKTKKKIAADVLSSTLSTLPTEQQVGLIAYGHREKGNCDDIEFVMGLDNTSKNKINEAISGMNALGKTPLARSATLAINRLKKNNEKATVILITDGIETCDGNICDIVTAAKADNIEFKLHVVGFGLKDGEKEQLQCAAQAGDGMYFDAANSQGLSEALKGATSTTVDDPAGNFSLYAYKNGEPVDALLIAKNAGKEEIGRGRTYQDTAKIYLPPGTYEVSIRPLENTDINTSYVTVTIKEGEPLHQDVSFDSGKLAITTNNNNEPWDATVRIYNQSNKEVAAGRTYGKTRDFELSPGRYDVKLMAIKLKGKEIEKTIEQVTIKPNETTNIAHTFESGEIAIGAQAADGTLVDATVNIYEVNSGDNVAASRTYKSANSNPRLFRLNPGTYKVTLKALGDHKGKSETITIDVKTADKTEKIITF